jgi:outer membrane protein TolC
MGRRGLWLGVAMVLAGAVVGCTALDLGPEPSNYVGAGSAGAAPLTDANLRAVTPEAGSAEGEAAMLPAASMPGSAVNPATLPSATQPTTTGPAAGTNPATQPGLGSPATSQPALGKLAVPRAVTLQESILLGLQNNTSLRVQRFNVPIQRTAEEVARAAFDPSISGQVSGGRAGVPTNRNNGRGTSYTDQINAQLAASEFFPTGTTVSGEFTTNNSFYSDGLSSSSASATVTQALLRGAGLDVNLASLRQTQLDTRSSQYELRGFAEALVDRIEETYWDLAFAERQVVIVQNALDVAEEQLRSTNTIIKVGRIAPTEQAAAEAEVALRRENLINAKSTLESTRLRFLQLITPPGQSFWDRPVALTTLPFIPTGTMDSVDHHVDVALAMRPEINQAKLQIQRGDLQVVKTRNGLLPQLDLFITLGQTGYSNSFGNSVENIGDGGNYNILAGVRGSYDIGNRAANGVYRAAVLSREQSQESLNNLVQTVQIDVRTQYIEAERTRQQIDATRATRIAQETALRVERGKFTAGNSTSLLVAQAQRDLLSAQLAEVQAVTGHLKALVALYRLEGSLLVRRGLEAPGATPVKENAWKH